MTLQKFENWFRTHRVAYVSVCEAKKAILPMAPSRSACNLRAFHFVVYGPDASWLVLVDALNDSTVTLMRAWSDLFGEGFRPIVARWTPLGEPVFRSLCGTPVLLRPDGSPPRATQRQRRARLAVSLERMGSAWRTPLLSIHHGWHPVRSALRACGCRRGART